MRAVFLLFYWLVIRRLDLVTLLVIFGVGCEVDVVMV